MKFHSFFAITLGLIVLACSPQSAPDYENRLKSIGREAVKLSETYNPALSYRDTIPDFAYGGDDIYSRLNQHHFKSDSARLEVGKGELDTSVDIEGAAKYDYFIKFIQGKKEVWLRLKYNRDDNKFHMVGYHTEKGR